jgi:hypothetical protein
MPTATAARPSTRMIAMIVSLVRIAFSIPMILRIDASRPGGSLPGPKDPPTGGRTGPWAAAYRLLLRRGPTRGPVNRAERAPDRGATSPGGRWRRRAR